MFEPPESPTVVLLFGFAILDEPTVELDELDEAVAVPDVELPPNEPPRLPPSEPPNDPLVKEFVAVVKLFEAPNNDLTGVAETVDDVAVVVAAVVVGTPVAVVEFVLNKEGNPVDLTSVPVVAALVVNPKEGLTSVPELDPVGVAVVVVAVEEPVKEPVKESAGLELVVVVATGATVLEVAVGVTVVAVDVVPKLVPKPEVPNKPVPVDRPLKLGKVVDVVGFG